MSKNFSKLALIALLATGVSIAQSSSSQNNTPQNSAPQQDQPGRPAEGADQPKNDRHTGPEKTIQSAIQQDPSMANSDVQVRVTDSEVHLSGTVPNEAAKQTAERIAQANSQGRTVKNGLHVNQNRQQRQPGPGTN